MTWWTILGLCSSGVGILGAFLAALRWLHKIIVKAVVQGVAVELGDVNAELRSNHGTSVKDTVTRLDQEMADFKSETKDHLDRQDRSIAAIYTTLLRK